MNSLNSQFLSDFTLNFQSFDSSSSSMSSSNGTPPREGDTENSLEKIKKQLSSGSGKNLLQGPLLKRSETLRKWNERWVILDPTTGKMEYKTRRNESIVKGTIAFDANSTITISPVNFHGLPKYDGCCFYIGTPQKKEYFLCAETPGATRAWVSTLHATQLVLKAHKEAVDSLSGNGSAKLGTVATVVAAANSTALESAKEIEAAMRISMRTALGMMANRTNEGQMDDLAIMTETLRVKDEELQHLARVLRARDSTIKEIAEKLTDTAEAAEAAASAAHAMDEQRRIACAEIERLTKDSEKQLESSMSKLRASEEKVMFLCKERDQLLQQRDSALREAQLWRSELGKAREQVVILEGAVVRAEERARVADVDAGARVKEAVEKQLAAVKEKEELLAYVNVLQAQIQRQQGETKQVSEEKSCSDSNNTLPLTKHVDLSEENVDKACLSVSRSVPLTGDQENLRSIGDGEWSDIQATDARIADVREIAPEAERSSLDIPVVSLPVDDHHEHEGNSFRQP
ncbi:Pleckstrin homology domain [Macleaya cordata]|uniref:Pleckstrin homology domain n=1 Tax=Macleaya cordata TaxID=56857 RepID=A0A200QPK4_MACCD|nr:Pleckstrin homology domain [Macleaya cordata]